MRTEELAAMLARGAGAADRGAGARRFAIALGGGGLAAALAMHALYGIRPTLMQDASLGMFWSKLLFVGAVAVGGFAAVRRLSLPGAALARLLWYLAGPVAILWLLAAAELTGAAPSDRVALILGQTWQVCAFRIALLSLPAFATLLWAMRGLAPTNLRLAGAAAGLCAGGVGALAYSFHCPELAAPFLGVWYVLGMLYFAVIGRHRLILSPEEEFAISGGKAGH